MPLDVRYLQVFQALLAERSITLAAKRLETSPSNVKRIVSSLEGELGLPLFEHPQRGQFQPTGHADRLQKEMQLFLGEMTDFRNLISEIRGKERVMSVAAHAWFTKTRTFTDWLEKLTANSLTRISVVTIKEGTEWAMVESGGCDVFVGPASSVDGGKRTISIELPELEIGLALSTEEGAPVRLEDLAGLRPWGIHLPGQGDTASRWAREIESAGGGFGRVISTSEFDEWSSDPHQTQLRTVIAPFPALACGHPHLKWLPFGLLGGISIRTLALRQHPYPFLGRTIRRVTTELMAHDG